MEYRMSNRGFWQPVLPPLETNTGVYRLFSKDITGSYIGSSTNLKKRCIDHFRDIATGYRTGQHDFKKAFNDKTLEIEILEYFPEDTPTHSLALLDAEERWHRKFYAESTLIGKRLGLHWKDHWTPAQIATKIRYHQRQLDYFKSLEVCREAE